MATSHESDNLDGYPRLFKEIVADIVALDIINCLREGQAQEVRAVIEKVLGESHQGVSEGQDNDALTTAWEELEEAIATHKRVKSNGATALEKLKITLDPYKRQRPYTEQALEHVIDGGDIGEAMQESDEEPQNKKRKRTDGRMDKEWIEENNKDFVIKYLREENEELRVKVFGLEACNEQRKKEHRDMKRKLKKAETALREWLQALRAFNQ